MGTGKISGRERRSEKDVEKNVEKKIVGDGR